jgi:magnesium chelatase family protein
VPVAKSYCVSLLGLAGTVIEIEAEISSNLPSFVLVGLPDASLSEAKDRVRSAIHNSGLVMPARRVTVNLSPASVPKQGSSFDLAIAMAVLAANQTVALDPKHILLGELGLDGQIRGVRGVLPALLAAKHAGFIKAFVPLANLAEGQLIDGIEVVGVQHLRQAAALHGAEVEFDVEPQEFGTQSPSQASGKDLVAGDIADIVGQQEAIDVLTIAAAGGHHLLMVGPPGAGKTMLAERLPTLLPDLTLEEALETTAVHSISAFWAATTTDALIKRPPFEAPHHSASVSSLVGGGLGLPRPGLISLANHGVLFMDEAPEFQLPVLEALRQPLETGAVMINRSAGMAKFPARFQLVMAANPCPCGRGFGRATACSCSEIQKRRYASKLSSPLLDRIDIRLPLRPVSAAQISLHRESLELRENSLQLRNKVAQSRLQAADRLSGTPWSLNAQVPGAYLRKNLRLSKSVTHSLDKALERGSLSMRGYDRCVRLAWTIADLAGHASPTSEDIGTALFIRGSDRPLEAA